MTTRHDPDPSISIWLQQQAPEAAPEHLVAATRNEIAATAQRRAAWSRGALRGWSRRTNLTFAMAAGVLIAVVGIGILPRVVRGPSTGVESPRATSTAVPSPGESSEPSSPEVTDPAGLSLDLAWTQVDLATEPVQVAWLDGQFVLVDEAGVVSTSSDGATWSRLQPGDRDPGYAELLKGRIVTWEDQIVGWWNPEDGREFAGQPPVTARDILRIVRPPADPIVSTPFEGRIQSVGIGPVGLVVETQFWPDESTRVDTTWFSADGIAWTEIQDGLRDPVGVSDGFIARDITDAELCSLPDGCGPAWHSADGLSWRNLGHPDADPGPGNLLVPWKGGALSTDGIGQFVLWTSQGYTEWPMAAEVPAQPQQDGVALGSGPLGLVTVRRDRMEILVTRDGVDWKIVPLPAAMQTRGDGPGPTVAVGEESVLYLTWSGYWGEGAGLVPSLWVGTVRP